MSSSARAALRLLLLLALAGLLFVGIAEAGVRLLGLAPGLPPQHRMYTEDPVLPFRTRPGIVLEGESRTGEFHYRYAHNSLGYRDEEHPFEKPPGTVRILVLGDSFAYGAGVTREAAFPARLEATLNEGPGAGDRPRVEVVNAAIPRFFPEAERLLLEHEGLRFEPDLVLVTFVPNDVIDTAFGTDALEVTEDGRLVSNYGMRLLASLPPGGLALYEWLHVVRIPLRAWAQSRIDREHPVRWDAIYEENGFHEAEWREVESQYDAMRELTRGVGARMVLLHFPVGGPWSERHEYPAERLRQWAEGRGVVFVDALAALREADSPERLYWPEDGHPRAAAHALAAERLREALLRDELLRGSQDGGE